MIPTFHRPRAFAPLSVLPALPALAALALTTFTGFTYVYTRTF